MLMINRVDGERFWTELRSWRGRGDMLSYPAMRLEQKASLVRGLDLFAMSHHVDRYILLDLLS